MKALKQYLWNWIILLDLALNTLFAGDPKEPLSDRMGRDIEAGRCMLCRHVCRALDLFQKDHCIKAWNRKRAGVDPSTQIPGD